MTRHGNAAFAASIARAWGGRAKAGRVRREPRGMNKLEAAWACSLAARQAGGEVMWWSYEPFRLRLADGAWYTPDFGVVVAGGDLELHETKGFMREAAAVRIKVAAEMYPFRFLLVRKVDGAWRVEEVGQP